MLVSLFAVEAFDCRIVTSPSASSTYEDELSPEEDGSVVLWDALDRVEPEGIRAVESVLETVFVVSV